MLTVQDHGCGMSEDVKKHIFDRFYRAGRSEELRRVRTGAFHHCQDRAAAFRQGHGGERGEKGKYFPTDPSGNALILF